MLALAGATMTTSGSSSMMITTSANDDTETRPLKRARNNSGSSGNANAEPNVSFAILTAVHHTSSREATAQATSVTTTALAAGTTIKRRSTVLLHKLAHNLVAEHSELYATATASRQPNISTGASTISTSGNSQQLSQQHQRATPSPVPSIITSNAPPPPATAVPIPMPIPATATVTTTALPEGQKLANGGAKIDVPLEENRYLCHIPQWAAALARQPKIAAPRPVAAFEKPPGQTLVRTTNQPPAVIGDKGLRSLVDLDLNINQYEPDPWQSQQVYTV
jgi:hypothetical protein